MKYKYGLALGGGGSKGFAHLGVIDVLESVGFKPDIIAGTSIGSIVGALYSRGFTTKQMNAMRENINLFKILKFNKSFRGVSSSQGLRDILNPLLGGVKFKDLEIKFIAVACDLKTGEEIILEDGSVIDALCASTAIPGIFQPVMLNEKLLADGGLVTMTPVNILRQKGAKKIVSSSLRNINPKMNLNTVDGVLIQSYNIMSDRLSDFQIKHADVAIKVPTQGLSPLNFSKSEETYKLGYDTAKKYKKQIEKLLK